MSKLEQEWLHAVAPAFRQALRGCAAGQLPANIAAMQLLMESRAPGEAEQTVAGLLERIRDRGEGSGIRHLQKVLDLLRSNPDAWGTVRTVLDDVRHDDQAMPMPPSGAGRRPSTAPRATRRKAASRSMRSATRSS
jgi:hypothetical protein